MPNFRPKLNPGIVKSDTQLQSEGGYCDGDRVRFWRGLPQPVGGWAKKTDETFLGKARGTTAWSALGGRELQAFGTNTNLYVLGLPDGLTDITPYLSETVLTDPFTTVNASTTVTMVWASHNLSVGDTFTISNQQAVVGGLTIDGTKTVVSVPTRDTLTFTNGSAATSTVTTPGGGNVDVLALLPAGLEDSAAPGAGVPEQARVWSTASWGTRGLFNPSGLGLFEWQPSLSYADQAYNGQFTSNADGWALAPGWTWGSSQIQKFPGEGANASQNIEGVAKGGEVWRVTFSAGGMSAGTVKFQVNAGSTPTVIDVDTASAAVSEPGTYSRTFLVPADAIDFVFSGDVDFDGWIDDVSYNLESRAYRIKTAPPIIDAMFVDPRGLVVALGTTGLDGEYDPSLIRNSALDNLRTWVPDSGNVSSYLTVKEGGRLMQGLATRQQNIVGTDKSIYSLVYQGQVGAAYKLEKLGENCGLISRHCMSAGGGFAFWASNTKQFWICRGIGSTSLGMAEVIDCPIIEDVFDHLDQDQTIKCFSGINSQFNEFWAWYPDTRDGSECSRVAVYSWTENHWVQHQITRTAWAPKGLLPNPVALSPDGYIYEHEVGTTDDGEPLNEFIETSYFDGGEGDAITRLSAITPDFKSQAATVELTITGRMYPNGPDMVFGPYLIEPTTLRRGFRVAARQIKMRFNSADPGGFWRFGANSFNLEQTGQRR